MFNRLKGDVHFQSVEEIVSRIFHPYTKQQTRRENYMKRLLLIALVASGLAFVPVQRSDASVWVGVGPVGVGFGGYYGYPYYGYSYYPYGYYRPYPYYGYYSGPSYYWYHGHRYYYRHHHHHHYNHD